MAFDNALRHFAITFLTCVCLLAHGGQSLLHAADDLEALLNGKWVAVAEENNGTRMKRSDVQKMEKTLAIEGNSFVLSWSGKSIKGTIDLKSENAPAAVDLTGSLAGRDIVLRAIADVNAETLRLCYVIDTGNRADLKRPTEFETEEGTNCICVTYERQSDGTLGWDRDMEAIQGEWRCVAGEENGKPQEQSKVRQEGRRLIIRRHSLTMDKVGSGWIGKFEIDATNGHFDWIGKSVPANMLTEWTGIYQLEGDELTLCFIFDKENKATRPTEFKSLPPAQPGLAHALYTFKRVTE